MPIESVFEFSCSILLLFGVGENIWTVGGLRKLSSLLELRMLSILLREPLTVLEEETFLEDFGRDDIDYF